MASEADTHTFVIRGLRFTVSKRYSNLKYVRRAGVQH